MNRLLWLFGLGVCSYGAILELNEDTSYIKASPFMLKTLLETFFEATLSVSNTAKGARFEIIMSMK